MAETELGLILRNTERMLAEMQDFRVEMRGLRDDQTVMIRMLQQREAELEHMRALEQRYQSLRLEVDRLRQRLDKVAP